MARYSISHPKYVQAREIAEREGVRFASRWPESSNVYAAMRLLGFRWVAQSGEWLRWHQPFIVLEKESA